MKTIFAPATAVVKSGVAIIRISGRDSLRILQTLTKKKKFVARMSYLCNITNPKNNLVFDEALVLFFKAPNSFTGEDTAEIHFHGSVAVISEALDVLSKFDNARLAEPGEFSLRAFENGKMDLTEAEGLVDLINAETKAQAKQALRQKQGHLSELYNNWREDIISILANIEAYIDFPDEEIPDSVLLEINSSINKLKADILSHLDDNKVGEKLRSGIKIAIVGNPNVGKSSIINALSKREVAIVSNIAGTTRDLIEVHLDLKGYPVTIIDTAGIREAEEFIEKKGIDKALEAADDADIKIVVFDISDKQTFDIDLVDDKSLIVFNKSDKVVNFNVPKEFLKANHLLLSTKDSDSIYNLIDVIYAKLSRMIAINDEPVITRKRHRDFLQNSLLSLNRFDIDNDLELACEDLRQAAFSIGKITGKINVDDVLDKIFSTFCIGK